MYPGATESALRGSFFASTVPDLDNANVGNQSALLLILYFLTGSGKELIIKTVLTIAGSDSSGGAGIQADIKTITCNGAYAMSAITALTAQNTTGVKAVMEVTPDFLQAQIDAVVTDIFPDAVKTGMVSSGPLVSVIASSIRQYGLKNVVVDPVMISTSGTRLLSEDAIMTLQQDLLPLATLITPNIPEAAVLTGMEIQTESDMETAARCLNERFGCAVLLKGGHLAHASDDYLYTCHGQQWFCGTRIDNPNNHGTGCTLSSAIAANLAKGQPLPEAVQNAKTYITGALAAMLDLGKGAGPMAHNWNIN